MEIAKDIVSDIIKGVEELLWPNQSSEDLVLTRVEESVERTTDNQDVEILSEKRGVLHRKVETGAVADICLQKYWFRISQGRAKLLVFCVFLTNIADIKVGSCNVKYQNHLTLTLQLFSIDLCLTVDLIGLV